jgi:hypothetical protein
MEVPVVKIQGDGGYIVINESDFDDSIHQLYSDEPPKPTAKAKATTTKDGD